MYKYIFMKINLFKYFREVRVLNLGYYKDCEFDNFG